MNPLPRLIGVLGKKGSGKDAFASCLAKDYHYQRAAFADTLKEAAQLVYGLSHEQVHGSQEAKEAIDPRWGISSRYILQRLGTECGRSIHPETWIKSLLEVRIPRLERERASTYSMDAHPPFTGWVIPDCRFTNEALAIQRQGGILVRVERPSLPTSKDPHPSEVEQESILVNFIVQNDGTLDDLSSYTDLLVHALSVSCGHSHHENNGAIHRCTMREGHERNHSDGIVVWAEHA